MLDQQSLLKIIKDTKIYKDDRAIACLNFYALAKLARLAQYCARRCKSKDAAMRIFAIMERYSRPND